MHCGGKESVLAGAGVCVRRVGQRVNLGNMAQLQGEPTKAAEWFTRAWTLSLELDDDMKTLEGYAERMAQGAQGKRAARSWGAAEVLREMIGFLHTGP